MTTTAPTPGARIRIHRVHGRRTVFVKTGLVVDVGSDGVIEFKDDSGPHVYLATNRMLASMGQSQAVTVLPPV